LYAYSQIKRRAINRKVAKPLFDSRCGSALLCPWERHLMLFFILEPSSLPVVAAQPDESMQTEQLLCWCGKTVQSIVQHFVQTKKIT